MLGLESTGLVRFDPDWTCIQDLPPLEIPRTLQRSCAQTGLPGFRLAYSRPPRNANGFRCEVLEGDFGRYKLVYA